jgi:hypothetical protein
VLQPHQGILTYYLLNAHESAPPPAANRDRTASIDDSTVSENTIDYDVVPRGTSKLRLELAYA